MALCDDCFQEFLHPLVHELMDKNKRFEDQFGGRAHWDWDSEAATITFSDPEKSTVRIDATVVGTTQGNSWEWTWANQNFPPHSKQDMEKVREFGEANSFDKLTSSFLDADEFTGWEMTAVAAHILDASGAYRFPTDEGFCYLIYRKIEEIKNEEDSLWGAMRGTVTFLSDVDLTEPTGEIWDAEQE
ncbi:MAG: DUF6882 domain-containing protein [Terracidiphilus sp.]